MHGYILQGQMSEQTVKDFYRVLGVPHNASSFQIQVAYEQLAHQWLPERNKDNREQAQARFHEINSAFQVLSTRSSRSHYDEILRKGYSHDDADNTFTRFFQEHDFINESERELCQSIAPNKPKTLKDHFEALGLPSNTSLEEIKQAYRTLALQYHPRSNSGDPEGSRRFLEVNQAYEVLSDQKRKEAHERLQGQLDPTKAHSVFQQFFGIKPKEFPLEEEGFEPALRKRWNRMLDRLMDEEIPLSQHTTGQTFRENSVYTRENGVEVRKNRKTRITLENGIPTETKIEEYIYPNGQRDITKSVTSNGKSERNSFHLKKGEECLLELTL